MDRDVEIAMSELYKIKTKNRARQCSDINKFYSFQQVLELVPVSSSTLYLMIKNGEFPKQIKLGKRAAVWSKEVVNSWIQAKLNHEG